MYRSDSPQVLTLNAAGDRGSAIWLGTLGNVTGLTYGYTLAGGADSMSCNLARHATFRSPAMDPARQVKIIAGASILWDGILNEPQPTDSGWQITGRGSGTFGDDYMAVFDTWANCPDEAVNRAVTRGLRWDNDAGIGRPAGMWLGQRPDPGSMTVTELLNLVCTRGGLTWYVNPSQSRNNVDVFPLPADPDRLLITSSPVGRTLGGDLNTIWIRYQAPSPLKRFFGGNAPNITQSLKPAFHRTSVVNQASVDKHGRLETFMDLSSAGPLGADPGSALAAAQAIGNFVLQRYQRASFAGSWTVGPGQLTNLGGTPVDLAVQSARSMVCKLILSDASLGGEVSPVPPQVLVGAYSYDSEAQQATVTAAQSVRADFAGLISEVAQTWGHGAGDWQHR